MLIALYRHFNSDGKLLYVGISTTPLRRIQQHKSLSAWFRDVVRIELQWYSNRKAAEDAERTAITTENPQFNVANAHPRPRANQICAVVIERSNAAISKHGGVRMAARVLKINPGVLSALARGARPSASSKTLRALGLKRVQKFDHEAIS
jgi:predicted GIY-YIG superfamily endonuclease